MNEAWEQIAWVDPLEEMMAAEADSAKEWMSVKAVLLAVILNKAKMWRLPGKKNIGDDQEKFFHLHSSMVLGFSSHDDVT